jgi:hypothetical protein
VPMLPLAPARFSTNAVWPVNSVKRCAIARANASVAPPGAKGTTILTERALDDCAKTAGKASEHAAAVTNERRRII